MSLHNNITEATQAELGMPSDVHLMVPAPLPCRRWSKADCDDLGVKITPQFIVQHGNALKALFRKGNLDSLKGYISILPQEILEHPDYSHLRSEYQDQPVDARVGALVAKLGGDGKTRGLSGAKVLHSNPFNLKLGIPRQSSEIVVKDLIAGTTLGIVEGTEISNSRTAFYSVLPFDSFFKGKSGVKVFMVGSGAVAKELVKVLDFHAGDKIASWVVCSPRSSQAFVEEFQSEKKTRFPMQAINNVDATDDLSEADLVITVTSNSKKDPPVIPSKDKMKSNVVVLSLGTNEQPEDFIEHVLQNGIAVCDTVANVSSRNAQALALYFSRQGKTLEEEAHKYRVREIFQLSEVQRSEDEPVLVACSGLAVMDVWYAYNLLLLIARARGNDPPQ